MTINAEQWAALEAAEETMYDGEQGAHAYTSVMPYDDGDGHDTLAAMWDEAETQLLGSSWAGRTPPPEVQEIARRVAAAQAILAFGVEYGSSLGMKAERAAMTPNSQEEG